MDRRIEYGLCAAIAALLVVPATALAQDRALFHRDRAGAPFQTATGLQRRILSLDRSALRVFEDARIPRLQSFDPAANALDIRSSDALLLDLPNGARVRALPRRIHARSKSRSWAGHIEGDSSSIVVLSRMQGTLAGYLVSSLGNYAIERTEVGDYAVTELPAMEVADDIAAAPSSSGTAAAMSSLGRRQDPVVGNPVIDVMGFYTDDARATAGGRSNLEVKIVSMFDFTNEVLQQNQMNMRVRLIGPFYVAGNYETGDYSTDLRAVRDGGDSVLDNIPFIRAFVGADLVTWIAGLEEPGVAGRAQMFAGPVGTKTAAQIAAENKAFNMVHHTANPLTLVHELGHNLGSQHDILNIDPDGDGTAAVPAYWYSYGYRDPDGDFRTIMAYADGCGPGSCERVPYFSSDELRPAEAPINGQVMGSDSNFSNGIDNRQSIETVAQNIVSLYAPTNTDWDGDGVANDVDNCPLETNNQADNDGDGWGNTCDLCPNDADTSNADTNDNDVGDACETCITHTATADQHVAAGRAYIETTEITCSWWERVYYGCEPQTFTAYVSVGLQMPFAAAGSDVATLTEYGEGLYMMNDCVQLSPSTPYFHSSDLRIGPVASDGTTHVELEVQVLDMDFDVVSVEAFSSDPATIQQLDSVTWLISYDLSPGPYTVQVVATDRGTRTRLLTENFYLDGSAGPACFTATNQAHVSAGRAYASSSGRSAYAVGTGQWLGWMQSTTSVQEVSGGWESVSSCP